MIFKTENEIYIKLLTLFSTLKIMHQGHLLKKAIKSKVDKMGDLPDLLGMSTQNINYHLRKEEVDLEFYDKIKSKIGVHVDEIENPSIVGEEESSYGTQNAFKNENKRAQSNAKLIGDLNAEEFGENTRFRQVGDGMFSMKVNLVTNKARAGWLRGFEDPEHIEELPSTEILVDFYHAGKYLAFIADGDSMDNGDVKEAIPDKTIIAARELEQHKWKPRLYDHRWPNWVFVHRTDGILVKQIADQNLDEGWIILHSLNPNKELYPDEKIYLKDIYKIYNVVKRQLP